MDSSLIQYIQYLFPLYVLYGDFIVSGSGLDQAKIDHNTYSQNDQISKLIYCIKVHFIWDQKLPVKPKRPYIRRPYDRRPLYREANKGLYVVA